MKSRFLGGGLALPASVLLVTLVSATSSLAATLTVEVEGLRDDKGQVSLKLFKNSDEFPKGDGVAKRTAKPSGGKATVKFENLEPGTYAMNGYHDENGDGQHDKSALGVPTEGFLFSNDVKPEGAPPDFQAASFKLKENTKITLHMQYWAEKKE